MKLTKYINQVNIYFAIWCLYHLQGVLYPLGSPIARSLLAVGILLSVYYWIKTLRELYIPKFLKVLSNFVIVLCIYAVYMIVSGETVYRAFDNFPYTGIRYLFSFTGSILPIFTSYYLTSKGLLKKEQLQVWFFIFLLTATGTFYQYEATRALISTYNTDGTTNNIAYHFVALIPLLLLFKEKPYIQYASMLYTCFFVMYGMKRGAILIAVICLAYIFVHSLKNSSTSRKLLVFGLICMVIYVGVGYIENLIESNDYFNYRLQQTLEGSTSDRDSYYSQLWHYFLGLDNPLKIIIGGGAYTSVKILGNLAHNDWLEILVSNGLLGITIYSWFWINYYKYIKKIKYSPMKAPIMLFFIILLLQSLFSMSFNNIVIYASAYLGYAVASAENYTEQG